MIGTYLVHGWLHLFMVQVDYRLFGTGWCMVDALVYGTGWCMVDALVYVQVDYRLRLMHGSGLLVQVYNGISHSDSVTVVPSFYFYFRVVGRGKDRWL
jgi:hypothetical protein